MMQSPTPFGDAKTLGSTTAEELWKKAPEESEPRPLKIRYTIEEERNPEDTTFEQFEHVVETVFEDPNEAFERPRLLVPLQSVLGLKALCEREFIRTEAVTDMLNQCRTAYYKELLYLREQLILAAEPEKQMMLGAVQNYEVYFFNPPAYVDEDLKEYMLNCSRWTHKKLIEENYELQMKLTYGQNDVFENCDFCLKGLLRRHGTYKLFKTLYSVVSNAKDLFNPEDDMMRRQEKEGLKPIDELQAAITELFPNLRSREDNSGALLSEIEELQRALTDAKTELARLKGLLESERHRSEELAKKCDDQERMLGSPKVTEVVDNSKVQELQELNDKMQEEVDAQVQRMSKMIKDLAAGKSYELGRSRKGATKIFPKLDEAILDLDKLFAKIAKETPQVVTQKVSDDDGAAQKEIQQLKQEIATLKAKLAAAEQREQDALSKLKDATRNKAGPTEKTKVPESPSNAGLLTGDVDELKKQLERKIAKVAELELELDQTKKDLRAAQRTIDEKDLLLQDKARNDADRAKKMSDLMEKLRKSEEEAEKLAGKLYKAEEKIKQLKEQIRELKNQLGMPQEQSEEEVEEEVDTSTVFMSRYYLRAKNSGKPRWMLLSEDAKYKSQKKGQDEPKGGGGSVPGQSWTSAHHQPQEAQRAFNFLRKAPGAPSRQGTQVRLQYSFTQASSLADGPDASPAASQASALNRMNTFHTGQLQDNSPMAQAQRLSHSNSMPFSVGGPGGLGDSPMGPSFSGPGGFGPGGFSRYSLLFQPVSSLRSRQGTSNSLMGPNGPNVYVPRASTPPQPHPIYAPGGGAVFNNAAWRGGQAAPSTGPVSTSSMVGPMLSNPFRDPGSQGPMIPNLRVGTPPQAIASGSLAKSGAAGPSPSAASPTVDTASTSLSVGGFSQPRMSPSMSPSVIGSPLLSEEDIATSSSGLPLRLPEQAGQESSMLGPSGSSLSLSPGMSSRVSHVGLAMVDPMSPQERPMLQLIPQRAGTQELPLMTDSYEVSPSRGPNSRVLERQAASWSAFPSTWSQGPSPSVVNLSMPGVGDESVAVPAAAPSDASAAGSSELVPSADGAGSATLQQVPVKRLQHAPTAPLDVDFATTSTPILSKVASLSKGDPAGSLSPTQGDSVDMLIQHAKSQPLSGSVRPEASSFVSWVNPRSKPLGNGSLPLTNSFKGKTRSMKSSSNLDSPVQYIQAGSLPGLPGGKVRKAPQSSWLTPL